MDFRYDVEELQTDALRLRYFQVPWDTQIFGFPVGQIESIVVHDVNRARSDFAQYQNWTARHGIQFASCRVSHDRVDESLLLQEHGFRFMELNYRPEMQLQADCRVAEPDLRFSQAQEADRPELTDLAARVFRHGRIHLDPALGSSLGNARYRIWMQNAFELPHQTVVKCELEARIAAFFVIEARADHHSFWSLVGLRPELQGQGWGKRIWRGMLSWQHDQGVKQVSTSISSLNNAVLNLYARLGFRFPVPDMTFHWHAT